MPKVSVSQMGKERMFSTFISTRKWLELTFCCVTILTVCCIVVSRDILHIKIYIRPCTCSDWSKTYVLSEYKTKEKRVLLFCARKIYILEQMKKPKPCITLWKNTPVIWEHKGNVENTSLGLVFSTFPLCSQMTIVFYHSVIHGLGFFIC